MKPLTRIALSIAIAAAFPWELPAANDAGKPEVTALENGSPEAPKSAAEVTPVGIWAWHNNSKTVPINSDGTIGSDHKEGTWKWIDEAKHTLQIDWVSGWVDKLTVSSDGKTMAVVNNVGDRYTVRRLPPTNEYEAPASE